MHLNHYHFITHWRVEGCVKEVMEVLANAQELPRWWPSVYLDVQELDCGDKCGIGKVVSLYTKGWLPYTLRWQFCVTEVSEHGFSLQAWGDFVGRGIWTFEQDGSWVNITYDWKIQAEKPLLRLLSPVLKPIFTANHMWAMQCGEESLRLEMARRCAKTPAERERVPAPPQPTTTSSFPLLLGFSTMLAAIYIAKNLILEP